MGFLLLDRPNPYGNHFYPTRNQRLLAIVVHVTAGSEDLDTLGDLSAENVSHYAATTSVDVSWHSGSDADSWVNLLPASYTAWHATNYNSCTYGHEISKRHTDWRSMPEQWVEKTLRIAAVGTDGKGGLRKVALDNGVPFRWATRAELDHARATGGSPVGFITHHEVQPDDRTDPGYVREGGRLVDTFPRTRFMNLLNLEDDMSWDQPVTVNAGQGNYQDKAKDVLGGMATDVKALRARLLGDDDRDGRDLLDTLRQVRIELKMLSDQERAELVGLRSAVTALSQAVAQKSGASPEEIEAAVARAIQNNTVNVDVNVRGSNPTT